MSRRFEEELRRLRADFPIPDVDAAADDRLAEQIAAAVRQALRLKTAAPQLAESLLGDTAQGDTAQADTAQGDTAQGDTAQGDTAQANTARADTAQRDEPAHDWPQPAAGLDAVVRELCKCLEGLPLETHPLNQVNVNAQPSTAGIIGALLPSLFNPNLSSDGRGAGCSRAERRVAALAARLAGYQPDLASGLFTFGGTGTMLYGVKLGLEKAIPGAMRKGIDRPVVVLASERAHHTCLTAAGWLGIGEDQVWRVPAEDDFSASAESFAACGQRAIEAGFRIAALIATVGTTDHFGVDDVAALAVVRDRLVADYRLDYTPHLHADAVIGWAWNVFRGYDFASNPLEFASDTRDALEHVAERVAGLCHADSMGLDFHKTGFAPYVSSLFLVRRGAELEKLARSRAAMPYLFHSGDYHPARYSLETTRSASGVLAAFASLRLLGRDGLRVLLGAAITRTQRLRSHLKMCDGFQLVNESAQGPVTLFRAYPIGWNAAQAWHNEQHDPNCVPQSQTINAFNRRIFEETQAAARNGGLPAVGWTDSACLGAGRQPLAALKAYLLSPFLENSLIDGLVRNVTTVREAVSRCSSKR
jgi:glutamate/tyrosine decarboxylase-like PLP-dependent enzyme